MVVLEGGPWSQVLYISRVSLCLCGKEGLFPLEEG